MLRRGAFAFAAALRVSIAFGGIFRDMMGLGPVHDPNKHGEHSWNWPRQKVLGEKPDDDDVDLDPPGWEDADLTALFWNLIGLIVGLSGCVCCIMVYTERVDAQRLEDERRRRRR